MLDSGGGEKKVNWGSRVITVSAAGLALGFGLCSQSGILRNQTAILYAMGIGTLLSLLSLLGLFVGVVIAVISGLRR